MVNLDIQLKKLFGSTRVVFITDCDETLSLLCRSGYTALSFADIVSDHDKLRGAQNAVVIPSRYANMPGREFFYRAFEGMALLFFPMASFSGDSHSIRYSLNCMAGIDFAEAVANNLRWLIGLERCQSRLNISGAGTDCELVLGDELNFMQFKTEPEIEPGEWVALAHFLEVALVSKVDRIEPAHRLSGVVVADGVAVAQHRYLPELVAPKANRAWEILDGFRKAGEFPLKVELDQSVVREVVTKGGMDILPQLLPLVDVNYDNVLVEMAFASAPKDSFKIDWSVNSLINEAAGGIHIALGTGLRGAHIDFISTPAKAVW